MKESTSIPILITTLTYFEVATGVILIHQRLSGWYGHILLPHGLLYYAAVSGFVQEILQDFVTMTLSMVYVVNRLQPTYDLMIH